MSFVIFKMSVTAVKKTVHAFRLCLSLGFQTRGGGGEGSPLRRQDSLLCTKIAWCPSFVLEATGPRCESPGQWGVSAVRNYSRSEKADVTICEVTFQVTFQFQSSSGF